MDHQSEEKRHLAQRRVSIGTILQSQEDFSPYIHDWLNEKEKNEQLSQKITTNKNEDVKDENVENQEHEQLDETATTPKRTRSNQKHKDNQYKHKDEKDRSTASPYAWDRNWILADGRFQSIMEGYKQKRKSSREKEQEQQTEISQGSS